MTRTSRWARMQLIVEATRKEGDPRFRSRVIVATALLVWIVDKTRWPVRAACIAIVTVSRSRISPSMMTSGSCRSIARRVDAKVIPILSWIATWLIPPISYSIGSSIVVMFRSTLLIRFRTLWRVVVFPEPVGPVTSRIPCGRRISTSIWASSWRAIPIPSRGIWELAESRIRTTTFSPKAAGIVDTLRSRFFNPTRTLIRPSCGRRFSAMSIFAMILIREMTAPCTHFGGSLLDRLGDDQVHHPDDGSRLALLPEVLGVPPLALLPLLYDLDGALLRNVLNILCDGVQRRAEVIVLVDPPEEIAAGRDGGLDGVPRGEPDVLERLEAQGVRHGEVEVLLLDRDREDQMLPGHLLADQIHRLGLHGGLLQLDVGNPELDREGLGDLLLGGHPQVDDHLPKLAPLGPLLDEGPRQAPLRQKARFHEQFPQPFFPHSGTPSPPTMAF